MGRVKIQMKKIEDRQQRNIAFAKRKSGMLKKAYELYTLCDVPVLLILFSPSNKLFIFDAKTRLEETINKYVDQPFYKRPRLQDEQIIRRLVKQLRSESMRSGPSFRESLDNGIRYQIQPKEIEDEIEERYVELAEVEQKLGDILRSPNNWDSLAELERREKIYQTALEKVQAQKRRLESKSKHVDVSGWPLENSMEGISSVE